MADILTWLGYRATLDKTDKDGAVKFQWPRKQKPKPKSKSGRVPAENSPFAKLQELTGR